MTGQKIEIVGIGGLGEIAPACDLAAEILKALTGQGVVLESGDVLVVTQKIVSKAEGRMVDLARVEPSAYARRLAVELGKDPAHVEVVLGEARRIVKMDRGILIAETRHGLVCANAGVDASNAPAPGWVVLLPEDPDKSAAKLRAALEAATGARVAVILSDTFGRPWRMGQVNVAVGCSGLSPLWDYRGAHDPAGREIRDTVIAIADELASAAELACGKLESVPIALIRGYRGPGGEGGAHQLVRPPSEDLFR